MPDAEYNGIIELFTYIKKNQNDDLILLEFYKGVILGDRI